MIRFTDEQLYVCSRVLWGKDCDLTRVERTVSHWVLTYLLNKDLPMSELENEESLALNLQYEINKDLTARDYDDFIVGCVCGQENYLNLSYGVPVHFEVSQSDKKSPKVNFEIVCDTKPYVFEKEPSSKQNLIDGRKKIIAGLLLGLKNVKDPLDGFLVEYIYKHIWMVNEEGSNTPSNADGFVTVWKNYLQNAVDGEPYEEYVLSILADIDAVQLVKLEDVRKYVIIKKYVQGFRYFGTIVTSLNNLEIPYEKSAEWDYKNIDLKKAGED